MHTLFNVTICLPTSQTNWVIHVRDGTEFITTDEKLFFKEFLDYLLTN